MPRLADTRFLGKLSDRITSPVVQYPHAKVAVINAEGSLNGALEDLEALVVRGYEYVDRSIEQSRVSVAQHLFGPLAMAGKEE